MSNTRNTLINIAILLVGGVAIYFCIGLWLNHWFEQQEIADARQEIADEQQRINDNKVSFSIDITDNVATPDEMDYIKVHIGIDGEMLVKNNIKVRLNGVDELVKKRHEIYYHTSYKYTFAHVPIAPQYVFELVMADGTIKHMTTIDNINQAIDVPNDIKLNLEDGFARFNKDFTLVWQNIPSGYQVELEANYSNNSGGFNKVPLVDTEKAAGSFTFRRDKFTVGDQKISYLQLSFIRDRNNFPIGEYFDNRSRVEYRSLYSNSINFRAKQ